MNQAFVAVFDTVLVITQLESPDKGINLSGCDFGRLIDRHLEIATLSPVFAMEEAGRISSMQPHKNMERNSQSWNPLRDLDISSRVADRKSVV